MKRIIVVSDTHRDFYSLAKVAERHQDADLMIHLGDGYEDFCRLEGLFPKLERRCVKGNCDFCLSKKIKLAEILDYGPARIFYTHGHIYEVKAGLDQLYQTGVDGGANIILYGHTHMPFVDYQKGVYVMNPGSLGQPRDGIPTYGIIDMDDGWINCHIAKL